jgi:glyoxylase-like metal-dependent hydrolase (beta-lactamase superfamily II)
MTPSPTRKVVDEEVLRLSGREFVSVHTPGHTIDHLCLFDPESGIMLSGDHVLPTITPHISGLGPITDPLSYYFDSLDKAAELPGVTLVLPAHGLEFHDLASRANDIKLHHRDRLQILRDAGDDLGRATVTDYMQKLFKERAWGSMAESETFAHLEHLRRVGEVSVSRRDELLLYEFS